MKENFFHPEQENHNFVSKSSKYPYHPIHATHESRPSDLINILIILLAIIITIFSSFKLLSPSNDLLHIGLNQNQLKTIMDYLLTDMQYVPFDEQMRARQNEHYRSNSSQIIGNIKYLGYRLSLQPENRIYQNLQHYYLDHKYNISRYEEQNEMCLIIHYEQEEDMDKFLLESIFGQDYANYKVIIGSSSQIFTLKEKEEKLIEKYSEKVHKMKYESLTKIQQVHQLISLCEESTIVIHVPVNGHLVGRQVLTLFNSLYTSPDTQIIITNAIFRPYNQPSIKQVISQFDEISPSLNFVLNENILKSYRKSIIPLDLAFPLNKQSLSYRQSIISFYANFFQSVPLQKIKLIQQITYHSTKAFLKASLNEQFIAQSLFNLSKTLSKSQSDTKIHESELKQFYYSNFEGNQKISLQYERYLGRLTASTLEVIHPKLKTIIFNKRSGDDRFIAEKTHIAYNLMKYPELQTFLKAEAFFYEFKFGKYRSQQEKNRFCLVADGPLIQMRGQSNDHTSFGLDFISLLKSVSFLEYENYKLVLTLNSPSQAFRKKETLRFISQNYPKILQKSTILTTNESIPNSKTKHSMIMQHCGQNDFVIPLQTDSRFIGTQFLKLMNKLLEQDQQQKKIDLIQLAHMVVELNGGMFKYEYVNVSTINQEKKFELRNHLTLDSAGYPLWNNYYPYAFRKSLYSRVNWEQAIPQHLLPVQQITDGMIYREILPFAENSSTFHNEILFAVPLQNFKTRNSKDIEAIKWLDDSHKYFKEF